MFRLGASRLLRELRDDRQFHGGSLRHRYARGYHRGARAQPHRVQGRARPVCDGASQLPSAKRQDHLSARM